MKFIIVLLLIFITSGCGSNQNAATSTTSTTSTTGTSSFTGPSVAGAWEFTLSSTTVPNNTLLVEANLQQNLGNVSASGNSILLMSTPTGLATHIGGLCPGNGTDSLSATINGNSITYSLNEGGNTFSATGTVTTSSMSGTYKWDSGTCPDEGTFTAAVIGSYDKYTFNGCRWPDPCINSATISESSDHTVIVSGQYNGLPFTLSGYRVGNAMVLSGYMNNQMMKFYTYLLQGSELYFYDENGAKFDDIAKTN